MWPIFGQVGARVIAVQLVILVGLAAMIGLFSRWGDDPKLGGAVIALQALQGEVEVNALGLPVLPDEGAVAAIAKANPGFWYLVRTATGELRSGNVPALLPQLDPALQTSNATLMLDGGRGPIAFAIQDGLTLMAGPFTPGPREKVAFIISLLPEIVGLGFIQLIGVSLALLLLPRDIRQAAQPLIAQLNWTQAQSRKGSAGARSPHVRLPQIRSPMELSDLAGKIDTVLLTLEQKISRAERFGGDIAHELRTPIAIMRNTIEQLEDGTHKRTMLVDLARMNEAVTALLDLARSDPDDGPFPKCDLSLIVRQAIATRAPDIIAAKRTISYVCGGAPVMAHVHAALAGCLVVNLIDNAVRHTVSRAIRVSLTASAELEVSDDGPSRYRAKGVPQQPANEGFGLGLALVRAIADRHGASFTLTDLPEGGKVARVAFQP